MQEVEWWKTFNRLLQLSVEKPSVARGPHGATGGQCLRGPRARSTSRTSHGAQDGGSPEEREAGSAQRRKSGMASLRKWLLSGALTDESEFGVNGEGEAGEKGHLYPNSHRAHVSSLLQVVGTGWGGPCFCCQPPRGPGRLHGAGPRRSPSCFATCALSPGKRRGWLATPSLQPLSPGPRTNCSPSGGIARGT